MIRLCITLLIICCTNSGFAQIRVFGNLTDITKYNAVEGADVISTGGNRAVTDSFGRYVIDVAYQDSIYFVYNGKPTQKFAVTAISRPELFEVSLGIAINAKYTVLKEVVVVAKTYAEDSFENRVLNEKFFNYSKPGLSTSVSPGGSVGADLTELINIFRFRRNKRLAFLQKFLADNEEEKYVNFRFSRKNVQRITGLSGVGLDSFLVWFRPSYAFTVSSNEVQFNQYVLNSLFLYRKIMPLDAMQKKEDE